MSTETQGTAPPLSEAEAHPARTPAGADALVGKSACCRRNEFSQSGPNAESSSEARSRPDEMLDRLNYIAKLVAMVKDWRRCRQAAMGSSHPAPLMRIRNEKRVCVHEWSSPWSANRGSASVEALPKPDAMRLLA
jgi:hypothetical protein